ncbi:GntR family transcriptional regulator [Salinicoccus kekensis]|uniref:GntR family transcriptional regulator n=1 Tax=Salinicoccus kekensis TaxID=714307 RepID=A0A285UGZ2_9STAP|nr:GntR family transcriptional regulator [Salinicoccus kekensis]SOC41150.1 GntR family transcriptional regulator [Salinicoccus kekensis]
MTIFVDELHISKENIIRNALQEQIINHTLQPGDKVPSENALADEYQVKRIEVRNALVTMEKMGLVESRQGVGRFIKKKIPTIELDISGRVSFSEKMKNQNLPYRSEVIHADYASDEEIQLYADRINCDPDEQIFKVARLRIVYDIPCAIHISYIREKFVPDIERDKNQLDSVFGYYQKEGFTNLKSKTSVISTAFPTIDEQQILKCNELVPLFIYETDTHDEERGIQLEFVRILYRSDLFKHKLITTQ